MPPITPLVILHLSIALATVGAQWTGVAALSHRGKDGAWMAMFAGAALSTLARVASVGMMFSGGLIPQNVRWISYEILPMMEIIGGLVFFIGFTAHALLLVNGSFRSSGR
ncbi:MAG: hypothetical protein EOP88_03450 [Verrucomicrobiaceae bacterium]|nr:MAG: hypothetical protein EOP88_03450 [Verrucomicrobiaceae bacterium]